MKTISINGHVIEQTLLIDDPEVKRAVPDASGKMRHIRSISQPGRLKSYLRKHPEGIVLAGTGAFFFLEPVSVTSAMIRSDERGNVDIRIREGAEQIEKQLTVMEEIRAAAAEQLAHF